MILSTKIRSIMSYCAGNWVINKISERTIIGTEMNYWRQSCRRLRMEKIIRNQIKVEEKLRSVTVKKKAEVIWAGKKSCRW